MMDYLILLIIIVPLVIVYGTVCFLTRKPEECGCEGFFHYCD